VAAVTDRVVLVSGVAGGIGGAVARRFTDGGWRVAGVDRQPCTDPSVFGIEADLRQVGACRDTVERTVQWGGRLDALVNAAGVWTEGSCADTEEADFDRVFDVNVKGLYFLTSAAVRHLSTVEGCVVNLSSDAGIQGNSGASVYCASKGAVSILTKALALELAPLGVRVNAVCPGDVDSPMLHGQARDFGDGDPQAYLQRLLGGYPQASRARFIRPAEVAELIWFLAQTPAAPITGANISIDFGLSAGIV
jgi:NAD(P)-dependent dehydrogenase (short-subunit alcohol dehydrogenase family)